MIPVALAAGQIGGQVGSLAKTLAIKAAPAAAGMAGGGYLAYQLTAKIDRSLPAGPAQAQERRDATVGAFTPIPAFAVGVAGLGGSAAMAFKKIRVIEEGVFNADTGEPIRLAREMRRGWTLAPRLMRAGAIGAIGGAAIAAGMAVPLMTMGANLVGRTTEDATRAMLPDWLEGPAEQAAAAQAEIAKGVGDGLTKVNEGKDPTVVKVQGTYERSDPTVPFDPKRELGLDQPIATTVEDKDDRRKVVADELERRFAEAGLETERVDP